MRNTSSHARLPSVNCGLALRAQFQFDRHLTSCAPAALHISSAWHHLFTAFSPSLAVLSGSRARGLVIAGWSPQLRRPPPGRGSTPASSLLGFSEEQGIHFCTLRCRPPCQGPQLPVRSRAPLCLPPGAPQAMSRNAWLLVAGAITLALHVVAGAAPQVLPPPPAPSRCPRCCPCCHLPPSSCTHTSTLALTVLQPQVAPGLVVVKYRSGIAGAAAADSHGLAPTDHPTSRNSGSVFRITDGSSVEGKLKQLKGSRCECVGVGCQRWR